MPIEIYTGKPGNGKTAFMLERMVKEAAKENPRPLIAYGINGLEDGLATVLVDPTKWNDIDPNGVPVCDCPETGDKTLTKRPLHAHVVPNGALVFIDEAWKWFGHLQDASRQPTPIHALALAEHRHRGVDFIWTSQGPNQIYPFVRPLIEDHYHCVRKFGSQLVDVYKWGELQEDVKSLSKREMADKTTRSLPKKVFGKYKSSVEHTIKTKLPAKVWAMPVMVILAGALLYYGIQFMRPSVRGDELSDRTNDAAQAATEPGALYTESSGDKTQPITPAEYAEKHLPRFPTMPHTAPVYDDRAVVSDPRIYCMSSEAGQGAQGYLEASVTCFTEQGTLYRLPDSQARTVARWGQPYNPYRKDMDAQPQQQGQFDGRTRASAAVLGARLSSAQMNHYGDIGVKLNPGS